MSERTKIAMFLAGCALAMMILATIGVALTTEAFGG